MDFANLKQNLKGEVDFRKEILEKYSRDASIFQIVPQVIVYPQDSSDIEALVQNVSALKSSQPDISITPRAAGTDMTGGPLNESIILDITKHMNHVLEVGNDYAVAEPGVYYRDFEKATLEKGLLFPSYPASRELCALGGMVANNAGGEKSLSYGKTDKYVQELSVVLNDGKEYAFGPLSADELNQKKSQSDFEGEIYRKTYDLLESNYGLIQAAKPDVSKNSAGYALWDVWNKKTFDLTKLFVGSQGTLGIITKIKMDLVRPKAHSRLLVIFLRTFDQLGHIVTAVNQFKPESFESYDDHTFKLALRFLPKLAKRLKGGLFSFIAKFIPELGILVMGGIPKMVLIAEFTGDNDEMVMAKIKDVQAKLEKDFKVRTHVTKDKTEADAYWLGRRESFSLLRQNVGHEHTAPFIDDVIVHPDQLPDFLPALNNLIAEYKGLTYTIAGHAGDANFHIIPLMDFSITENRKAIPELSEKVYDLVLRYRGSITAEHNDGLVRSQYLEKMYGPELVKLFQEVKNIFDPLNIFNPGKKVGASKEYAWSHMITK